MWADWTKQGKHSMYPCIHGHNGGRGERQQGTYNRIAQTSMFSSGFGTCRQDDGITHDAMQVCSVFRLSFSMGGVTEISMGDWWVMANPPRLKKSIQKHSCWWSSHQLQGWKNNTKKKHTAGLQIKTQIKTKSCVYILDYWIRKSQCISFNFGPLGERERVAVTPPHVRCLVWHLNFWSRGACLFLPFPSL